MNVVVTITKTGGLGPIELELPPGKLSITPASRLCLEGIGQNRKLLAGAGIDWGSGSGCLAIAAARIPAVERIVGIEVPAWTWRRPIATRHETASAIESR